MSKIIDLAISFSSLEPMALMKDISNSIKPFNQRLPNLVTDGFNEYTDTQDWIDQLLPTYKFSANAYWGSIFKHEGFISYDLGETIVKIQISDYELIDAESVMKMLAPLPWTVAAFGQLHRQGGWKEYVTSNLESFHFPHGWACAFKGEGHNHLVSRRWLEFGPWRLIRDEVHDISFVQFHDLNAAPATALEQARPGHLEMGGYSGGYFGKTYPFSNELRALYVPDDRNMRVVIPAGFELTHSFVSDYCAARYFQAFENQPFDTLSFVFIVADEAQQYLHELWLREIEVSGFTPKGVEVRLDTDYHPTPNPPDWVRRLEESQDN
jgi:hypothetical protein